MTCVCVKKWTQKNRNLPSSLPKKVTIQHLSLHISGISASAWLKPFDGSIFLGDLQARNIEKEDLIMDDGYIRMINDQSCHLNLWNLRVSTVYLSVVGCDPPHCSKTCTQVQRFKFNCEGWCFHWGPWPFLAQGPCRCNHTLHISDHVLPACLYKMAQEVRSKVPKSPQILEFLVMLMSSTLQGCGKYSAFHSLSEPSKPTSRIRGWRWVLAHNPNY